MPVVFKSAVVEIAGDLYKIGGAGQTKIQKFSCSSRVCTWTTINQQLKLARSYAVAIAVTDALCTSKKFYYN